jgi:hypothetical protein
MLCACAMLSSVAFTALQYFSALSLKRHDFLKKMLLNIKYVICFSRKLVPETSYSKQNRARYQKCVLVFM